MDRTLKMCYLLLQLMLLLLLVLQVLLLLSLKRCYRRNENVAIKKHLQIADSRQISRYKYRCQNGVWDFEAFLQSSARIHESILPVYKASYLLSANHKKASKHITERNIIKQWSKGTHKNMYMHEKKKMLKNVMYIRFEGLSLVWKEMSDYNKESPLGASSRFLFVTQVLSSISSICKQFGLTVCNYVLLLVLSLRYYPLRNII